MPAHLRRLPMCQQCTRSATKTLHNTANALIGHYCDRCADKALAKFQRENEPQGDTP